MSTIVVPTSAPVIEGPSQGKWTCEAWEQLIPDDGNRYEIIGGVLYMTTAPSYFHQWVIMRLVQYVGIPAVTRGLAFAVPAPVGVLMPGCDPVQPDFVVVLQSRAAIIHNRHIRGIPDLIIEVISPGSHTYDEHIKLDAYATAGLPEYAIVDPSVRTLSHYRLNQACCYDAPSVADEDATIVFDCLPDIVLPIAELFAGAPDTTL